MPYWSVYVRSPQGMRQFIGAAPSQAEAKAAVRWFCRDALALPEADIVEVRETPGEVFSRMKSAGLSDFTRE